MSVTTRLRVFFSHSSGDADWVQRVAAQAAAAGVEVYLAEHDISPGQQLSEKVTNAIGESDAVIVLLSKNSLASVYVQQEIGVAHHARKLVIPILMGEVLGTDLGILNDREYILLDPAVPHDGLSRLSSVLAQLINHQREKIEAEARRRLEDQLAAQAEEQERLQRQLVVLGWHYTNTSRSTNDQVSAVLDSGPIGLPAVNVPLRAGDGDR